MMYLILLINFGSGIIEKATSLIITRTCPSGLTMENTGDEAANVNILRQSVDDDCIPPMMHKASGLNSPSRAPP